MSVGEAGLEEMQDARGVEGEAGREVIQEARDVERELGVETDVELVGGRTGMEVRVTLVTGSMGSDKTISQYLSQSWGDMDEKMGV